MWRGGKKSLNILWARLYPVLQTSLSHHAHPSLPSPAGGGGHAPHNTVMGLRLKSTYWNDFSSLAQCQNLLKVWWVYFINSRNAAEREREMGGKGEGERDWDDKDDRVRGESPFQLTIASVHHPPSLCVCVWTHIPSAYTDVWSKFDVDPRPSAQQRLLSICCRVSGVCYLFLCPWELSTDMPVSLSWTALVNCSLNSPALDSAFGGKINYLTPPYISQSIFSMLGPITPSKKTTLYVISKMTSIFSSTRSTVNAPTTSTCATKERANALVTHTLATPSTQIQQLRGGSTAVCSVSRLEGDHPGPAHRANATDGLTVLMKADYQEPSINLSLIMTKRVCG